MAIKQYTITLGSVTNNGVKCTSPVITRFDNGCLNLTCIDDEKGIYEVEVDGACTDQCFDFYIICEECGNCPPVLVTKCLCEDSNDCGDCQECRNGICVDRCPTGKVCVNDICVDCSGNGDCPGDQQCINGTCACPPGTTPSGDRCLECIDGETDGCYICLDGTWVYQDCGDGACDPETGNCEECINEDQCRPDQICVDNECECPPGFSEQNGVCVENPQCLTPADCPPCHVCRNGQCVPQQCPAGQVCIGEEGCVPVCDCNDLTGCDDVTRYCSQDPNSGLCGCVPCQGDCTQGCQNPCFCSDVTQNCVNNPCEGPCNDGLDCGDGCGCLDGQCFPCELISCLTGDCDRALGCDCNGINCQDSDGPCNNAPCATSADCGEDCTCVEGECVSCSNFPCAGNACSNQEGCACVGGECTGDPEDPTCSDLLTIEKSDADCTITGTFETESCCQCPQLIVDSLATGSLAGSVYNVSIETELRKGVYSGASPFGFPRLDSVTDENIAENESPTSGTIRVVYIVVRDIYNASGGFLGTESDTPVTSSRNFPISGTTASVTHTGLALPAIGSEVVSGGLTRRVKEIQFQLSISSTIQVPSGCSYLPESLYDFIIRSNSDFGATQSLVGATGIGTSGCRNPLFKWYKTNTGEFPSIPFRKLYIGEDSPGTYVDIIPNLEEGAESCYEYLLETDCSCTGSASDYIVFCNPSELDYTLSNCNKTIRINSFSTCSANSQKQFYVQAGSLNITFLGNAAPIGTLYTSATQIETIEFGLSCDQAGQCTKTYATDNPQLEPEYTIECSEGEVNITFELNSGLAGCFLNYVVLNGTNVPGGGSITLDPGEYSGTAYWTCACDPTDFTITNYCCEEGLGEISRDCNSLTCITDPNTSYFVSGVEIANICGYLATLGNSTATTIRAVKPGCDEVFFPIPALTGPICCGGLLAGISENTPGDITITVVGYNLITGVNVSPSGGILTTEGPGVYRLTGLIEGSTYTITITDSICGNTVLTYGYEACLDEVSISGGSESEPECQLIADSNQDSCDCFEGNFVATIDNVNDLGSYYEVDYTTSLTGLDNGPVLSTLTIAGVSITPTIGSGTFTLQKPISITDNCDPALISGKLVTSGGLYGVQINLLVGGINIFTSPDWAGFVATVNGDPVVANASGINTAIIYSFGATIVVKLTATYIPTGDVWTFQQTFGVKDFNTTVDFCKAVIDNSPIPAQFVFSELLLEDGCRYGTVTHTFQINAGGTIGSNTTIKSLPRLNPTGRKIKYVWVRDGIEVYEEYSYTNSTLPYGSDYYDNGAEYVVTASCNCEEEVTYELCCPPEITATVEKDSNIMIGLSGWSQLFPNSRKHKSRFKVSYLNLPLSIDVVVTADDGQTQTITLPAGTGLTGDYYFNNVPWKETPEIMYHSVAAVGGPILHTLGYYIPSPWEIDRALRAASTGFKANSATACAAYADEVTYYIENQGAGFNQINLGQFLYSDRQLVTTVNGSGGWIAVNRDNAGITLAIQVAPSGEILSVVNC